MLRIFFPPEWLPYMLLISEGGHKHRVTMDVHMETLNLDPIVSTGTLPTVIVDLPAVFPFFSSNGLVTLVCDTI